jgi:hypothetical protein
MCPNFERPEIETSSFPPCTSCWLPVPPRLHSLCSARACASRKPDRLCYSLYSLRFHLPSFGLLTHAVLFAASPWATATGFRKALIIVTAASISTYVMRAYMQLRHLFSFPRATFRIAQMCPTWRARAGLALLCCSCRSSTAISQTRLSNASCFLSFLSPALLYKVGIATRLTPTTKLRARLSVHDLPVSVTHQPSPFFL